MLEAAKKAHEKSRTSAIIPIFRPWAACGICVVKVEGSNKMHALLLYASVRRNEH
jgi:hypothetical protein